MKKRLFIVLLSFYFAHTQAQNGVLWKQMTNDVSLSSRDNAILDSELFFSLDEKAFKNKLSEPLGSNKSAKNVATTISIPNVNGKLEFFNVWEFSNFDPELQAKYPEIRAYEGVGIADEKSRIYLSISPSGIQTMILRNGKDSEFIEKASDDTTKYRVFSSKMDANKSSLVCYSKDIVGTQNLSRKTSKTVSNNQTFKTFRLALSCTGEYTTYFGGTKAGALAGMNATLTRVNGIFNRDLALKLVLIANNDDLIYTNASTDPYANADFGKDGAWSQELQTNLTNTIGNDNYDIGHLFGASGGGGDAGCMGCVCVAPTAAEPLGKGSAYTSPSNGKPEGDTFDIDYAIHEFGHQLGAYHTFSYQIEDAGVNVEPGTGSTIMGYAGVTNTNKDVQKNSDDYFAYASILQIQNNLASKSCGLNTTITNTPPVVNAGLDYTIPFGTPFILKGTGSDSEGDSLTYCWEQYDSAITTSGDKSLAVATKIDGPLFRSFKPVTSPVRYMPSLENVLKNQLTSSWESVSAVARQLHFTLTVRDNAALGTAQTNTDQMIVNVSGSIGPFAVTSQNTGDFAWYKGEKETVTWSVNNTNTLSGSTNVNIKLSTDGGLTFPITLVANTPNDGSEVITVPDVISTDCRLLIEPTDNIYYAINTKNFAIGYSLDTTTKTYVFTTPVAIPDASSTYTSLNIIVPASGDFQKSEVLDVNVSMNLTHANLSDIDSYIQNPQGIRVKLYERNCPKENNTLNLVFDDSGNALDCKSTTLQTVTPTGSLSDFNKASPVGTWTLFVRDNFLKDLGTINSASLTITTRNYTLATEDFEILDFALFPNPNTGDFKIQFTSHSNQPIQVFVYDISGKEVYQNTFETTVNFSKGVQLKNAKPGIYLLKVIDGNRKTTRKIIVK